MKILLAGDIHADKRHAQNVVDRASLKDCQMIIALGDFGFWFEQDFLDVWAAAPMPVWFLRGNHDSTEWIRHRNDGALHGRSPVFVADNLTYLPDGCAFVLGGVTFAAFGGAFSIDRDSRIEHHDWWPDEGVRLGVAAPLVEGLKVDVVLSHDAPHGVPRIESYVKNYKDQPESTNHREAIGVLVDLVRPEVVYHGHYHLAYHDNRDGAIVRGLDMNGTPLRYSTTVFDTDVFLEGQGR